ncbi:hypothetical protein EV694_2186 [Volucribacter psittacicida]|uniref:Uncharacterized protein n=1 Tax=Volucribacter psittacicida TaxID=203482 RepID=A0A4R1FKR5_9PAST|nr:hypothetical protein [Volucribacter psittacicida]TCJ93952.1 hypothetical protein EV694_2186 [Volucribacter psittacicida]
MKLNTEQQKTQISSSHRLINITSTLRHQLSNNNYGIFDRVSSNFLINEIFQKLEYQSNITVSKRQSALFKRAKDNLNNYNSQKLSSFEYATEALFDNYFFKNNKNFINRVEALKIIKRSIIQNGNISLVMPILSRKPFSPIKNKGY